MATTTTQLVLVGACYLDTILSVPHYPSEDSKLRATHLSVRRGGNCANTLEVLLQLLASAAAPCPVAVVPHLVSPLPRRSSPAVQRIADSFACADAERLLQHCLFRDAHAEPASSYIVRSAASGSRTIVNYNALPEMTLAEFEAVVRSVGAASDDNSWWHFEGRIPETTLACMLLLRSRLPACRISVEIEKPGRHGLDALATEADVVFYSRAWAELPAQTMTLDNRAAATSLPEHVLQPTSVVVQDGAAALLSDDCLHCPAKQAPSVVDTVGAGDTFIAGILYGLICHASSWSLSRTLQFAVDMASLKVQREGFQGLVAALDAAAL